MNQITFKLVSKLSEAFELRKIRNPHAEHFTQDSTQISLMGQLFWFYHNYLKDLASKKYRAFLCQDSNHQNVGYGALEKREDGLWLTVCVDRGQQGKGYGKSILEHLKKIAIEENSPLLAEIWASNQASCHLHEKVGFTLVRTAEKKGSELKIYQIAA